MHVTSLPALSMAISRLSVFRQNSAASVAALAMILLLTFPSAQAVEKCTSGIDVTSAAYSADPTGATDSSSAFNAAIVAAGGVGTVILARSQQGFGTSDNLSCHFMQRV